jgi:hypothetical protein
MTAGTCVASVAIFASEADAGVARLAGVAVGLADTPAGANVGRAVGFACTVGVASDSTRFTQAIPVTLTNIPMRNTKVDR